MRDYDAVERAFKRIHEQFSEMDVVDSGAASNFLAPVLGMSTKAFNTVIDIDVIGTNFEAAVQILAREGLYRQKTGTGFYK